MPDPCENWMSTPGLKRITLESCDKIKFPIMYAYIVSVIKIVSFRCVLLFLLELQNLINVLISPFCVNSIYNLYYLKGYLVKFLHHISAETLVPPVLQCGGIQDNLHSPGLFFSSGGDKTLLHYNDVDLLTCLLDGTQEFVLFDKVCNLNRVARKPVFRVSNMV